MIERDLGRSRYRVAVVRDNGELVNQIAIDTAQSGAALYMTDSEMYQFIEDCLKEFGHG